MNYNTITPAQYLRLNRAKERRKRVILAHVTRIMKEPPALNSRLIKDAITRDIKRRYGIRYVNLLPADQFDDCMHFILTYKFHYIDKLYG